MMTATISAPRPRSLADIFREAQSLAEDAIEAGVLGNSRRRDDLARRAAGRYKQAGYARMARWAEGMIGR